MTLGKSATATTAADLSGGQYTAAELFAGTTSNVGAPPAADIRLWAFSGSHVTTYRGSHGTIAGPGPPISSSPPPAAPQRAQS